MSCDRCPCPASCLAWPVFCAWAAESPPDPVKVRHICHRSAFGPALTPSYPPAAAQADSLARALWLWATGGEASGEEQARRLATCGACPLRNAEDRRCWRCGCYTDQKIKIKAEHCPEGKW